MPTQAFTPTPGPVEFVWQVTCDSDPLEWPGGMALDGQGNLYVADTRNHRVQIYTPEGQLLDTWGK